METPGTLFRVIDNGTALIYFLFLTTLPFSGGKKLFKGERWAEKSGAFGCGQISQTGIWDLAFIVTIFIYPVCESSLL